MKQAYVDGKPIPREAVEFELSRLTAFYATHGMSAEEIKKRLPQLMEKAQEQAIGAKLLFDRAAQLDLKVDEREIDEQLRKVIEQVGGREAYLKELARQKMDEDAFRAKLAAGCRVDMLVRQACTGVPDPTEQEVEDCWRTLYANSGEDAPSLADAAAGIRDLLRHERRGRAVDALVEELREKVKVEYK